MTTDSLQVCSHLANNRLQPSATMPDEQGRWTRYCAPCVADPIESRIKTKSIGDVVRSIRVYNCGHFANGTRCGICFTAILGSLMVLWAHAKVQRDGSSTANRLGKAMRSFRILHGTKSNTQSHTPIKEKY